MGKKNNILISLSGGLDSVVLSYYCNDLNKFDKISAIGFNYGQRHKEELNIAKGFAERLQIDYKVIDIPFLNELGKSYLMNESDIAEIGNGINNTFVAGRNILFLSILGTYAFSNGYNFIGLGANHSDFNGYPDCRKEFLENMEKSLNLGLGLDEEDKIRLFTPFQYHTKRQIFEEADRLGVLDLVVDNTLSCYNGIIGNGCGKCPACKERAKGYASYRESLYKAED